MWVGLDGNQRNHLQCIFLLYLHLPMTLGAQKLYNNIIQPLYIKHHGKVDNLVNCKSSGGGFFWRTSMTRRLNPIISAARRQYEEHVKPT